MDRGKIFSASTLLLTAAMAAVLLMHMVSGSHSRMLADDYCTTLYGQRDGLIGGLIFQYSTWAGQFSNILFKNLVGVIGNGVIPLLPSLLICTWLAVTFWSVRGILNYLGIATTWLNVSFMTVLIVFVTIAAIPVPIQPLYWLAALVPYTIPVIGATALIGLFARFLSTGEERRRRFILGAVFVVSFVSAGFSEVYASLQAGALLAMLLLTLLFRGMRPLLPLCLSALAGTVIAMIVIIAAPGNAIRRSSFPEFVGVTRFVSATFTQSLALIFVHILSFAPVGSVVVVITAFVAGTQNVGRWNQRVIPLRILLIPMFLGFAAVSAYIAAGVYGVGSVPPARTYTAPQMFIFFAVIATGFMMGLRWRKQHTASFPSTLTRSISFTRVIVALLIVVLVVQEVHSISTTLPILERFSDSWDERDLLIRQLVAEGQRDVNLPELPNDLAPLVGLQTHTDDPDFWVNDCTAEYYGVETFRVYADM